MNSGERFIPEEHDVLIALEHWHRYLHILDLIKDKEVLDIASGTGYGTNILSESAKKITGIDISEEAVLFSKKNYIQDNLNYLVGSIEKLPFNDKTIDVIISFETIEHVSEELQFKFLAEVKRVLKDDGIFIVSTPEKYHYSDIRHYSNEFHIKEFYEEDFRIFLNNFFTHIDFNYQTTLIGSNIFNNINNDIKKKYIYNQPQEISKEYVIAYCSNQNNIDIPNNSINIDYENKFFLNLNSQFSQLWKRVNQAESKFDETKKINEELWERVNQAESKFDETKKINEELWKRVNQAEKSLEDMQIKNRIKRFFRL